MRRPAHGPFIAAALWLVGPAAAAADAVQPLPPLVVAGGLGTDWRAANLPGQQLPVTRYLAEDVDGRPVLRMEALGSYGNLMHAPAAGPLPRRLAWSWRLAQPNPGTDLRRKAGDDLAAKVCLAFELPLARVPFGERMLLSLARARSGEPLPAATLCGVWAGAEPRESVVDNAYSRRVRFIVLRNASDTTGAWLHESRDIAADFLRAFGDEVDTPPPLQAVLVGADADNTGGRSLAHLDGLRFEP